MDEHPRLGTLVVGVAMSALLGASSAHAFDFGHEPYGNATLIPVFGGTGSGGGGGFGGGGGELGSGSLGVGSGGVGGRGGVNSGTNTLPTTPVPSDGLDTIRQPDPTLDPGLPVGTNIKVVPNFPSDMPAPIDGVDLLPPILDLRNPPEVPGVRGYCGAAAVCGGDPTPGIPGNLPTTPGVSPTAAPRLASIITGQGFAATVALRGTSGGLCSGVVISQNVVLTAAHCYCDSSPSTFWIGNALVADADYRRGFNESRFLKGDVTFFDASYCATGSGVDLAAVHPLDPTAIPNAHFQEFVPTSAIVEFASFAGTIVGFGASDFNSLGGVKRHATIKVRACTEDDVAAGEGCLPGQEWISFNEAGVDTCKGDSGGPLYMIASDHTYRLVGLTSRQRRGASVPYCGDGGIYTNLATEQVISWINLLKKEN